jgi:hypothetical protein
VNENAKEGNLFSSLTYGVGSVSSKMSELGSKAYTNINTYWTGEEGGQMKNSSSSGNGMNLFGRSGYDSLSGQSNNDASGGFGGYHDNNNNNNNNSNQSDRYSSNASNNNVSSRSSNKKNDDWNDWGDSSWGDASSSTTASKATKTTSSKSKSTTKNKDLINFEDDNWETIEPSKSK